MKSVQEGNGVVRFRVFRREVTAKSQLFLFRPVFNLYKRCLTETMLITGMGLPFMLIMPDEVVLMFENTVAEDIRYFLMISDERFTSQLKKLNKRNGDLYFGGGQIFDEDPDIVDLDTEDKAMLVLSYMFARPDAWEKNHKKKLPGNNDGHFSVYASEEVMNACEAN